MPRRLWMEGGYSRSNAGPKRKRPGVWRARSRNGPEMGCYLSELLMASKFELSLVPRPFTAVMIAIAIPAAIRPCSMAVAPDSSLKNDLMIDVMVGSDLGEMYSEPGCPRGSYSGTYGEESKAVLTDGTQLFRVVRDEICSNLNETLRPPIASPRFSPGCSMTSPASTHRVSFPIGDEPTAKGVVDVLTEVFFEYQAAIAAFERPDGRWDVTVNFADPP